jgi:hypothetical protein
MQDLFINSTESIALLYGETLYIVSEEGQEQENKSSADPQPDVQRKIEKPQPVVEKVEPTIPPPQKPGINWRPKPASRMLFILQQTELKDPILTDFLRKIVEAVGIPFDNAGFGIIQGPVNLREFEQMPNRYGVVFDGDLWMEPNALTNFGDNEVFFTSRLAYLQNDKESKQHLWNYLKNLKEIVR